MAVSQQAAAIVAFLVETGGASPREVGVCVLHDQNGRRAWQALRRLREAGYVHRPYRAMYVGNLGVAASQRRLFA